MVYQVDLRALKRQNNDYPLVMIPVLPKDQIFPQLANAALAHAHNQPLSTIAVHHQSHLHGLDLNDVIYFNNANKCPNTVYTCQTETTAAWSRRFGHSV